MINAKPDGKNIFVRGHSLFDPNQFFGAVLLGIVSGAAGGLIIGIAARASMRAVAILGGMTPDFSVDGTLFVIGIGVGFGILLGLFYAFILPYLPGSVSRKGLTLGLLLSILLALLTLMVEQEGELALVSKWVLILLFASLPLIQGLVMGQVAARLVPDETSLVAENGRIAQTAALIIIVAAIVGFVTEMTLIITYPALSTLGYSTAQFLENAAGGALLFMSTIGIVGLLRSGATGKSVSAKIGLSVALLIFTLMGIGTISEGLNTIKLHGLVRVMTRLEYNEDLILLIVFVLVGFSGLLLGGIAVWRARQWTGWRRTIPLLVGLYPFLSLLILHPSFFPALVDISISGRNQLAHGIAALFALCWLALGIALRGETEPSFSNPNETIQVSRS